MTWKCNSCKYLEKKDLLNVLNPCNTCKFKLNDQIDGNYYDNYWEKEK